VGEDDGTGDRWEIARTAGVRVPSGPSWMRCAEACTGQKCQQWERCFITRMRRLAVESDVIIVNHHLFFADLAIKQFG